MEQMNFKELLEKLKNAKPVQKQPTADGEALKKFLERIRETAKQAKEENKEEK